MLLYMCKWKILELIVFFIKGYIMVIYGLAIMATCMLAGKMLGLFIGTMLGIHADVGGVGFAMFFLILVINKLTGMERFSKLAESGVKFWSAMYIPIVVAMCAKQNVFGAVNGGGAAVIAGILTVCSVLFLMKPLTKMAMKQDIKNSQMIGYKEETK